MTENVIRGNFGRLPWEPTRLDSGPGRRPRHSLAEVLEAHPTLTWQGFGVRSERQGDIVLATFDDLRRETLERADRIAFAVDWLDLNLVPIAAIARDRFRSTYTIKHIAEKTSPWGYASQGEIAIAAIMLGWTVRQAAERGAVSRTTFIAVSKSSVQAALRRSRGQHAGVYISSPPAHAKSRAARREAAKRHRH